MIARLLASVCLLYVSVPSAPAQSLGAGELAVYLRTSPEHSAVALREMKVELEALMHSAGVNLKWWNPAQTYSTEATGVSQEIAVLDLRGTCQPPREIPDTPPVPDATPLGSTAVADGRILPFSSIDCTALARFAASELAALPEPQADFTYGRALARLAAHELYHVVSQQSAHAASGIAKASFTRADLLANQMGFEDPILANLNANANANAPNGHNAAPSSGFALAVSEK